MRWRNPQGQWQHPSFVALRHIVVEVQDEVGKPIEGALVEVGESSGDLSGVHHGMAKTDAEGKIPAPFAYGALLLTDYAYKATDEAPEPDSRKCRVASYDCRYDLRVTAEGYEPAVIEGLDPDEAWVGKTVALKKE